MKSLYTQTCLWFWDILVVCKVHFSLKSSHIFGILFSHGEPIGQMSPGSKSLIVMFVRYLKDSGVWCCFPCSDIIVAVKTYWIRGTAALQGPGDAWELLSGVSSGISLSVGARVCMCMQLFLFTCLSTCLCTKV